MSKKDPQYINVGQVSQTGKKNNHYYFADDTVEYLQSKYYPHIFHYCYFISSETYPHGAPESVGDERFTIRRADEEGSVVSVGPTARFNSLEEALGNIEEIITHDKKERGIT